VAARALLRSYISDGAGNGLSPPLRSNITLGGMCQWSQITRLETHVLERETGPSHMIATAMYMFEVHDTVRLSPMVSPFATIPPDASISTSSEGGVLGLFRYAIGGLEVAFSDESYADGSEGILAAWSWDFGDSGTSIDQNPTHAYAGAGTYTVSLTVTSSGGSSSTISAPVTVV
jgi:hypothetical protein